MKAPPRGAGDKVWIQPVSSPLLSLTRIIQSLAEIASQAEKLKVSQLQLVEKIIEGKIPDIKPPIKKKLVSFVKTIKALRKLDEEVDIYDNLMCAGH